jgi:hypothetical protein
MSASEGSRTVSAMYSQRSHTAFFMEIEAFNPRPLRGLIRANRSAILLLYIAIAFLGFSLAVFLFSLPSHEVAASTPGVPTYVASAASTTAPLEVHIANNGLVLLRNAQVIAINGDTLTVSTAWGSTNFRWLVRTNSSTYETHHFGTDFLTRDGQTLSIQDIAVGDVVIVTGMLDSTTQEPTLNADVVRTST